MLEGTVYCAAVVVIDVGVLMVEGAIKDAAFDGGGGEHAGDEWFEFDVTVVQ